MANRPRQPGLSIVGGFALTAAGVAALAVGAMGLVVAPVLWILGDGAVSANSPTAT